jgi:hypothetical protein
LNRDSWSASREKQNAERVDGRIVENVESVKEMKIQEKSRGERGSQLKTILQGLKPPTMKGAYGGAKGPPPGAKHTPENAGIKASAT